MHLFKHKSKEYKLIAKSKFFDKRWYLKTYPDVAAAGIDPVEHYLKHGWREGRNPSPSFDTKNYLLTYKSVNDANVCPLVHFETQGKYQGLKTSNFSSIPRIFPKGAQNIVKKFKISKKKGRTVIFATFNNDGIIPDTTVYYLQELKKIATNIIVVSDNPILPSELSKIEDIACFCQFVPHGEYDFGSYKQGFMWAKENKVLNTTSELVLCNDSCYGPIYEFKLMFDEMQKRRVDFWGVCANIEFCYHIQSYFMVFSNKVFKSQAFNNFISNIKRQPSVKEVIKTYETQFTKILQNAGFSCDTYIPYDKDCMEYPFNEYPNSTMFPVWSVKQGCPLVKVKAITQKNYNFEGIEETLEIIKQKNKKLFDIMLNEKKDRLQPYFSIILPTYNRKQLTVGAIHSILAQTYQNFEIIVVDDGSKDNTKEYIYEHFAEEIKNKKIRYFYKPNEGVCKARNYGLKYAKYNWIAYMDSDNTMMPNFLATFAMNIRGNTNSKTFYCKAETSFEKIIGQNFDLQKLIRANYIDLGIFVHHISVYKDLGGFDENMTRLVDWELIVRYSKKYQPTFIPKVCMLYNDINNRVRISNNNSYVSNLNYYRRKHSNFPTITTIIATYNQEKYIAAAIDSAINQTGDFVHNILISDDGSTDKTPEIIKKYAKKYPHLIHNISRRKNYGISNNMKYCFENASGEYVAVLKCDDCWAEADKLQKQMEFFRTHPERTMIQSYKSFEQEAINGSFAGRAFKTTSFAEALRTVTNTDVHVVKSNKILVHLHLYYHDQLDFFISKLKNITCDYDLIVTYVEKNKTSEAKLKAFKSDVILQKVVNRGYDVWPFLQVIKSVDLRDYSYVLKVHTKNYRTTVWNKDGILYTGYQWRDDLINPLLASKAVFNKMLKDCEQHPEVGLVGSRNMFRTKEFADQKETTKHLCTLFKMPYSEQTFIVGTMFMIKSSLLNDLKNYPFSTKDFAKQSYTGCTGTLAHSLETFFGLITHHYGQKVLGVDTIKTLLKRKRASLFKVFCSSVKRKTYKDVTTYIAKSKYFNKKWYLKTYPDVAKAKVDPIEHYLKYGWKEGKNPSAYFDTNWYLSKYADIKAANINPLLHYEQNGKYEGRERCSCNICANRALIKKLNNVHGMAVTKNKRKPRIIVSITTFPGRINEVVFAIYSIMQQTMKPDEIVLWLGEDKFKNKDVDLPKQLLNMKKCGLKIKYIKDLRSFTKLVPALKEYPDDIIVTADDDIFYKKDWLEKLYKSYLKYPQDIHCHRVHKIIINKKRILPYNDWQHESFVPGASYLNFITGVGGVLYPPHALHKDVLKQDVFEKLTPLADDIWFWAMAIMNNVKIRNIEKGYPHLTYVNADRQYGLVANDTLANQNVLLGKNDTQLANVLQKYPKVWESIYKESKQK